MKINMSQISKKPGNSIFLQHPTTPSCNRAATVEIKSQRKTSAKQYSPKTATTTFMRTKIKGSFLQSTSLAMTSQKRM